MKIDMKTLRVEAASSIEAPMDFAALCTLLAAHQAATPTARIAREADEAGCLVGGGGGAMTGGFHPGSFHQAAAAVVGHAV